MGSAGSRDSSGPSQRNIGEPFTPVGSEMEQVRVRESPAIIGEGGLDLIEISACTAYGKENEVSLTVIKYTYSSISLIGCDTV